jgi:hypothetical protein
MTSRVVRLSAACRCRVPVLWIVSGESLRACGLCGLFENRGA